MPWEALQRENDELRARIAELDAANHALIAGEIDAVLTGPEATLLRRAQRALQASEQLFHSVFDSALDGILIADDDGAYVEVNPAACAIFGLPRAELIGRRVFELAESPAEAEAAWAEFRRAGVLRGELRLRRPDGELRDLELSACAEVVPGCHLTVVRDVTQKRHVERERQASEERYRQLFDAIPQPVLVYDTGSRLFLRVNEAACRQYGYGGDELVALSRKDLLAPGASPVLAETAAVTLGATYEGQTQHRRKDGSRFDAAVWIHAMEFEERPALLIVVADITERLRLEEQLRQVQRIESIGRLAGGIAHDFNNILGVIMGYSASALRQCGDPAAVRKRLEGIESAAERAAALTRQLLAFSRKQVLVPRVLDMASLVGDLSGMIRRMIGEDIQLVPVVHPDLGQVRADPSQIEQVVLNLVVNARDAMPSGGTLVIELENVDLDAVYAAAHIDVVPGRFVRLGVTDTGVGMDAETQRRIFEPFFTTKEPGRGTGLGLATVYGIVKQSGGHITVESAPGRGARFGIYLPRVDEAALRPVADSREPAAGRGHERVLLVEDDALIRLVAREGLGDFGYDVLTAEGPQEAIELYRRHQDSIALVVTDVVMPGLSGWELADRLEAERPQLPILFVSGYSDEALARQRGARERAPFLQKPFTPGALARKIREVLDRSSGAVPSSS